LFEQTLAIKIMNNVLRFSENIRFDNKQSKLYFLLMDFFYIIKPLVPRGLQLGIRRVIVKYKRKLNSTIWPIDERAGEKPVGWPGWPDNKEFALALMHDVDTQTGYDKCYQLMDFEENLGVRSTFNLVPEERYPISATLLQEIKRRKFGLGVHGLNHDGKLFLSYKVFREKAVKINEYIAEWKTAGFSSPSMHHRLEWMYHLNIEHSISTFDTDPFEPQPDAVCTIFPFVVENTVNHKFFIELPYTLPQDFTLFILLREKTIDLWKKKLDWIAKHGGMALVNIHPDYINFKNDAKEKKEEYPIRFYSELITYIKTAYAGRFWNALPEEISAYVKSNYDFSGKTAQS
jgi:hypothetical protein